MLWTTQVDTTLLLSDHILGSDLRGPGPSPTYNKQSEEMAVAMLPKLDSSMLLISMQARKIWK